VSKKTPRPTAEQLRAELVQVNRDILGTRRTLQSMRDRRADLRVRLREARAVERWEAADSGPDENLDVGGEG
jgi:hypothetical protein